MELLKVNLFVSMISAGAGFLLGGPIMAAGFAAIAVSIVLIWHNMSAQFVLKRLKAIRLTEASAGNTVHRLFLGDAHKLGEMAGLPRTRFFIIDAPLPMAFSMGSKGSGGRIIVTTGLFKTLSRLEIAAVTAHELGHIKAGERAATSMELGLSILLTMSGLRPLLRSVTFGLIGGSGGSHLSNVQGRMMRPDCRADAFAAKLCQNSAIMSSALQKLERGVRSSSWDAIASAPMIARLATVNPRHVVYSAEHPEHSPMAHRVAELNRLEFAKAA